MKAKPYVEREFKPMLVKEAAFAYRREEPHFSVSTILGLENAQLEEPLSRVKLFRDGFSKATFDRLKDATGLDYNQLATALSVSTKTLQRKEVFELVQSEKMYELAELYAMGYSYFGKEGFRRWMERPLFSIGNVKPIDVIDVSEGMELLKGEIMRVQHGIAV